MQTDTLSERIQWVDYAKGICIILVVMMHTVHRYEHMAGETGWLSLVVDFAQPFRMPDFFLISGLFLSRSLHGPTLSYFDRKLVHFIYFYVLWLSIQHPVFHFDLILEAPGYVLKTWMISLIEPTNTLWFVHMLAVFYVVTWLVRDIPKWIILAIAIALQTAYAAGLVNTDWNVIDRFCARYVFFYIGFMCAPYIFRFAEQAATRGGLVLVGTTIWGLINYQMVALGIHQLPGNSLLLGLAGAFAICAVSALLAKYALLDGLRYAGQNSIVIYLTFFAPMLIMEEIFYYSGDALGSVGLSNAICLAVNVAAPLVFHRLIRKTWLIALYERPELFRISGRHSGANRLTGTSAP
ncbi:MAG: acyltransferase family protein [Pseudomonadota bacterium]